MILWKKSVRENRLDCFNVTVLDRRRHVIVGSIWRLYAHNVYSDSTVGAETVGMEEGGGELYTSEE